MKPNKFLTPLLMLSALSAALLLAPSANAEDVYKHIDEQGRVTYSNKPIKGGKKVDLPPLTTLPTPKPPPPAKPTPKAEAGADKDTRRRALAEEIIKTEKTLQAAKAKVKEEADIPETFKRTKTVTGKDGKPAKVTEIGRNVAAYEDKMKRLNEDVAQLEKTLEKLKAEIAGLDAPKVEKPKEDKN